MYEVVIEYDPENCSYGAMSPDVGDNVLGVGKTEREAIERFRNALRAYIAFLRERGALLPEPLRAVAVPDAGASSCSNEDVIFHNHTTGDTIALDGDDETELPLQSWERLKHLLGLKP